MYYRIQQSCLVVGWLMLMVALGVDVGKWPFWPRLIYCLLMGIIIFTGITMAARTESKRIKKH